MQVDQIKVVLCFHCETKTRVLNYEILWWCPHLNFIIMEHYLLSKVNTTKCWLHFIEKLKIFSKDVQVIFLKLNFVGNDVLSTVVLPTSFRLLCRLAYYVDLPTAICWNIAGETTVVETSGRRNDIDSNFVCQKKYWNF